VLLAISFSQSEHSQDFGDSMIYIHCAGFWQTHNNATAQRAAGILPAEFCLPTQLRRTIHERHWLGVIYGLGVVPLH